MHISGVLISPYLFKKTGRGIIGTLELAEVLTYPYKPQAAADVTDVGIVIRGKVSTVPGGLFMSQRNLYPSIKSG